MSEEEKDAQLGRAMRSYQQTKENLGHLEHKVKTVIDAYHRIGAVYPGDLDVSNERVWHGRAPLLEPGLLMNEKELVALLTEQKQAKKNLADADALLKTLGVSL